MPTSTSDFVTNLVTNVASLMPCPSCGTLGFEPELRAAPAGLDK